MGAPQLHRVTPPKYVHIEVAKTEFSQHGLSFALLPYVFSRMPTLPDLSKREYNLFNRVECSQKKTGEKWMADQEQLDILKQGVEIWNQWRREHPSMVPDLSFADPTEVDLDDADLSGVDFSDANLREAQLGGANLSEAVLYKAKVTEADLSQAN